VWASVAEGRRAGSRVVGRHARSRRKTRFRHRPAPRGWETACGPGGWRGTRRRWWRWRGCGLRARPSGRRHRGGELLEHEAREGTEVEGIHLDQVAGPKWGVFLGFAHGPG